MPLRIFSIINIAHTIYSENGEVARKLGGEPTLFISVDEAAATTNLSKISGQSEVELLVGESTVTTPRCMIGEPWGGWCPDSSPGTHTHKYLVNLEL